MSQIRRSLVFLSKSAFSYQKTILKSVNVNKSLLSFINTAPIKPVGSYNPEKAIEYETSQDQNEWKFVERILPQKLIPEPVKKDVYSSGWVPQNEKSSNLPFYVRRTKNHMMPVHLKINNRGQKKVTHLRHIEGDIWLLEKDLRSYLTQINKENVGIRVDEVGGKLVIKGDQVNNIFRWLSEKGF